MVMRAPRKPPWISVAKAAPRAGPRVRLVRGARTARQKSSAGAEEARMLEDVEPFVLDRRIERPRRVPEPERQPVQAGGRHRSGEPLARAGERAPDRCRRAPAPAVGNGPRESGAGPAEQEEQGGATAISSPCCAMCAESSVSPSRSSGETSAATSAVSPAMKERTWSGAMPRPRPARAQRRSTPRP